MAPYVVPCDVEQSRLQSPKSGTTRMSKHVDLRQTLAQTRELLQHEKESRERTESSSRAIDEVLAMLAHELRQPVAAALAAVEIQKQSPRPDRQERARRVIEQQVRYIARLVGDLSEVSRMSHGTFELRRERLDICGLIRETLAMTEPLFEERKHEVTADLGDDPVWVSGDGIRLKQIFSNLLRNAASYTPPGGEISVHVDVTSDRVRLRVKDNGAGIPRDLLAKIFDLFQRGAHRADGHGSGIGLAVVRRLVELHGGSVTAASDGIGHGSEFTVFFPRDLSSQETALH